MIYQCGDSNYEVTTSVNLDASVLTVTLVGKLIARTLRLVDGI